MSANDIVHLIDDDEAFRRALAFQLGTAGFAVKIYESAVLFLEKYDGSQSGCIVSDVRMPGMDGLRFLQRLKEMSVTLLVVIMTGHADVTMAVKAMKAGANDFIEKPFTDEGLLEAVRSALTRSLKGHPPVEVEQIRGRLAMLTPREREVLNALVAGQPNKTIAYDLGVSSRTVEVHRANVMTKMGAANFAELVRMSLLAG